MVGTRVVLQCSSSMRQAQVTSFCVHYLSLHLAATQSLPRDFFPLLNFFIHSLITPTDLKLLGMEIALYFFVTFLERHFLSSKKQKPPFTESESSQRKIVGVRESRLPSYYKVGVQIKVVCLYATFKQIVPFK